MRALSGKVAVVTGAASGIGRAMVDRFAAAGMKVVMADIERAALEPAAAEVEATGAEVLAVPTDVSRGDEVDALAASTLERFGAVHLVCNNAGVGFGGRCWEVAAEDWRWVLDVNLWGVINGIRAFVPHLVAQGEGHVVNTASLAGLISTPMMAPYNATKFAVVAISETLSLDLAAVGSGVGVSVLCPGMVNTRIGEAARNRPAHLPPTEMPAGPEAEAARELFQQMLRSGMPPAEVADRVHDAVVDNRFYILTHEESVGPVRARMERILEGRNPESVFGG